MSTEVPTTRDIIATGLHQLCVDRWNQFDGASTRHGVEVHHTTADAAVAALVASGKTIVDTPTEWEWGLRRRVGHTDGPVDEDLARRVQSYDGGTVVRRRPAGEWEVVPDVE